MAMMVSSLAFGQLKVHAPNGDVGIGNSAIAPAAGAILQINHRPGGISSVLRFKAPNNAALFNFFDAGTDGLSAQWNVDMNIGKPNGSATLGFFRSTNTTGPASFLIFEGNNTPNSNIRLAANSDSYFNAFQGNVGIGTQSPLATEKLHVEGHAYKTLGGDAWNIPSDRKLKNNIKSCEEGLDIIMDINTVSYEYNGKAGTHKGEQQIGVIAQELQKIAPYMVSPSTYQKMEISEFGDETIVEEDEILTINASAIKWLLVNAVQEQQEQIEILEEKLEAVLKMLDDKNISQPNLENDFEITLESNGEAGANLGQNRPNPFDKQTIVNYSVPENAKSARIEIYDISSRAIRQVSINATGKGQLIINAENLNPGVYTYSLIIDNKVLYTKKMILQ